MENALVTPLVKLVPSEVGRYQAAINMVFFANGGDMNNVAWNIDHMRNYYGVCDDDGSRDGIPFGTAGTLMA